MTTMDRRCPNGHPIAVGAAFCTACGSGVDARTGTPLRVCPYGHPVAAGVAYCPKCGFKVDDASGLPPTVGFAAPPPTLGVPSPPGFAPNGPPATSTAPAQGTVAASVPSLPAAYGAWQTGYALEPQGQVSGFAIAAFVVSLVWLYALTSIVAIILASIALRRIRERGERGRGLAIAAIVLGAIGLLIGLGVLLAHAH